MREKYYFIQSIKESCAYKGINLWYSNDNEQNLLIVVLRY